MTRILLLFAFVVRTIYQTGAVEGLLAIRLGENCHYDVQCQQKDSNSECDFSNNKQYSLNHICTCKAGYKVEIINDTEKCVPGDVIEEEKEGLTAAPIILCFMGCVIVEAFCLLAFRYWKKHRRAGFRHQHTLRLEAFPLPNTRVPQHVHNRPIMSFMITSQVDSTISNEASSPPPYSQTAITEETFTPTEDAPPSYDEAMKHCDDAQSLTSGTRLQHQQKRKMSC